MTAIAASNAVPPHACLVNLKKEFGQKTIETSYIYSVPETNLTPEEDTYFRERVGYAAISNGVLPSGAHLFGRISHDPDYYVGYDEDGIIIDPIADKLFDGAVVTEMGSGDGSKTLHYFENSKAAGDIIYQDIDVSSDFLDMTADKLERTGKLAKPALKSCSDFFNVAAGFQKADVVLFLGTTISNFDPLQAQALLKLIRDHYIKEDGVLVLGQDGNQDLTTLGFCYDDRRKNTAAFVMNGLRQIRRDMLPELPLNAFRYDAFFDASAHTMRMGIRCISDVRVPSDIGDIEFAEGEFVRVGQSRKYPKSFMHGLLEQARFKPEHTLSSQHSYNLHLARACRHG